MTMVLAGPNYCDVLGDGYVPAIAAGPSLVTSLPTSNLQNSARGRVARTTGLSTQVLSIPDFGVARPIGCVVLWRHNLTAAATVSVALYSGAAFSGAISIGGATATAYSIAGDWAVKWHSKILSANVSARSMQITITDAANPDGYMQFSRLFAGPVFFPGLNPDFGAGVDFVEDTEMARTRGGSIVRLPGSTWREMSLDHQRLTTAERHALSAMLGSVGRRRDVFISLYQRDSDTTLAAEHEFIGTLLDKPRFPRRTFNRWAAPMVFAEI